MESGGFAVSKALQKFFSLQEVPKAAAQVAGKGGSELEALAGNGMEQRQGAGVERGPGDFLRRFCAVQPVPQKRTADMGHVDAKLVCASGFGP